MDVLTLNRRIFTNESTVGDLHFGHDFFCNTLEDTCRHEKIPGKTAIPAGRYEIVLAHSKRFNRSMPRLLNVPNYEGILMHWGNNAAATDGCILVGLYSPDQPNWISESRKTFARLYAELETVNAASLWITIAGGAREI